MNQPMMPTAPPTGQYPLAPLGTAAPAAYQQPHYPLAPAQQQAAAGGQDDSFELQRFLQAIQTRMWTVITVTVLVFTSVAIYTFTQDKIYRSAALLLIEPMTPIADPTIPVHRATGGQYENYLRTQQTLLRSQRIARLALKRLGVRELPGYESELVSERRNVNIFINSMEIRTYRQTRILEIAFLSPNAKFAARASNGAVEAYIEDTRRRSSGIRDQAARKLRARERTMRPLVQQAREKANDFRIKHGLFDDGREGAMAAQLKSLSLSIASSKSTKADVDAMIARIENEPVSNVGRSSERLSRLTMQLLELDSSLKTLRSIYTDNHPKLVPIVAKRKWVVKEIEVERKRLLDDLRIRSEAVGAKLESLAKERDDIAEKLEKIKRHRARAGMLLQKADVLTRTHAALLKRVEEIETQTLASRAEENIWVIDRARPSGWPAKPRIVLQLAVGLIFGLFIGVSLALLLEFLNNTITSKEEVEQLLGLGVIGFVPKVKRITKLRVQGKLLKLTAAQVAMYDTSSQIAEAFRSIRTGLDFVLPSDAPRRLLITSAMPNDGKSLVAANVAIALARMGRRVILVDADLRKASLSATFGLDDGVGLVNSLLRPEEVPWQEMVRGTPVDNLELLTAGPSPANPAELLGSPRMAAIIEELNEEYDWVIIDAPPVGLVADAAVLTNCCPNVAFVVRAFCTTRKRAQMAVDVLRRTPATAVSAIFNTVDIPGAYYYSGEYYYGYYYYGSRDKAALPAGSGAPGSAPQLAQHDATIEVEHAPAPASHLMTPPPAPAPSVPVAADGWIPLDTAATLLSIPRTAVVALARERGWASEVRLKPDGSDELFFRAEDLRGELLSR